MTASSVRHHHRWKLCDLMIFMATHGTDMHGNLLPLWLNPCWLNCCHFAGTLRRVRNCRLFEWQGDVENVSNYRPICSLPALYTLFSTILYGRFYPVLDQKQAEDQAGFRKSYQTTDHLATYRLIEQKCHECGIKMWTSTVDFTKAFDSISQKSIWEAHKSCNIDHDYISLLRKIYRDQKASEQTDEESNIFDIQKGSKQGDPLSSLLFNKVLQYSLNDEIQRWQKKKEWVYT